MPPRKLNVHVCCMYVCVCVCVCVYICTMVVHQVKQCHYYYLLCKIQVFINSFNVKIDIYRVVF